MTPRVVAVHAGSEHALAKQSQPEIELVAGLGVVGDVHHGAQVRHRSRVRRDPTQPNLRQVHLINRELFDLVAPEFSVAPGDLGENITTEGLAVLELPVGAMLKIGEAALVAVTGRRNPCGQINGHADGLMAAVLERDEQGDSPRLAGIMGVVVLGGTIRPDDGIEIALPPPPHRRLERV